MILYIRPGCNYCEAVLKEADELGFTFELRDISEPHVAQELIDRGGKQQVPYLVDDAMEAEMYESEDIISYLHAKKDGESEGWEDDDFSEEEEDL